MHVRTACQTESVSHLAPYGVCKDLISCLIYSFVTIYEDVLSIRRNVSLV